VNVCTNWQNRHVIDLEAALGQQFRDIAVGQSITQPPAHRDAISSPGTGSQPGAHDGADFEQITGSASLTPRITPAQQCHVATVGAGRSTR
jgi:hypothetical protein